MSEPRNHHYVPQFHLRRFASAPGSGRIWRYDKASGAITEARIASSAALRDYYTLQAEDGTRDQGIEIWLGEIENRAAPALHHLLELPVGLNAISDDDRIVLALYLAILHTRGPASRVPAEALADFLGKIQSDVAASRIETDTEPAPGKSEPDATTEIRIVPPPGWVMLTTLQLGLEEIGPRLAALRWYMARRTAPPFIVIGDQPVAPSPGPDHPRATGVGIGSPGVEVVVPVAPDAALVLKDEDHDGRVVVFPGAGTATPGSLPDDWVMLFNDGQWARAERFVFARHRADLEAMVAALGEEGARRTPTISVSGLEPSWEPHLNERIRAYRPTSSQRTTSLGVQAEADPS